VGIWYLFTGLINGLLPVQRYDQCVILSSSDLIMGHSPLSSMINGLLPVQRYNQCVILSSSDLIMGLSPLSSMINGLLSLQAVWLWGILFSVIGYWALPSFSS
jgi:hypothetical protein